MAASELVAEKEAFVHLSRECEKIIDTRKRLPDFVFQRRFPHYFVIEYGHIPGQRFGNFLSEMSGIFKDESVNYMAIDPPAGEDFYRSSSFFGLISFAASDLRERYAAVMHPIRGASTILAGTNIGVFWGSSLKWGIFCDRISWEIAVIAVSEYVDVSAISGFRCLDAAWLSDYEKSQYHAKDPSDSIASDFMKKFMANYPI
jgi:hypothetical protein